MTLITYLISISVYYLYNQVCTRKRKVVVRIVLSLLLLVSAITVITTTGCGNTDFVAEEEKVMADKVNILQGDNITQEYKTATFALG
jgi:hypothetical protein